MKSIPLFLVLTLTLAWGYTSWYWYTCNIKGACELSVTTEDISGNDNVSSLNQEGNSDIDEREQGSENGDVQTLSRDDVLIGESIIPQAPVEKSSQEDESIEGEIENDESRNGALEQESEINIEVASSGDLCTDPLIGPISIASSNSPLQVSKLETFLIDNAYLSDSDGLFGSDDLEAVKKLQLDYKEQMLDPWGIETPTGYVGKTTVATINSIGCKN